jgi:hypothetical protein
MTTRHRHSFQCSAHKENVLRKVGGLIVEAKGGREEIRNLRVERDERKVHLFLG